jgi:oligopeptidase A
VTLFHEFGHGLHHLLTRVDYPSIAGINGVAWDAVELPSQFLENYAWHPEVLQRISAHFETGEPLPKTQQARLIQTRSFHAGLQTMRQLEFALFDFRMHTEYSAQTASRTASATSSPAATLPVTTATSGRKCWPRTPSRPSRRVACSTPPPRRASWMPS